MARTAEELWQLVSDYTDKDDHAGTIECLQELIRMGDTEAISSLPVAYYSYAVDLHNYAMNLTDNGARIKNLKQASSVFYTVIDMALAYLKLYPEDMENGNMMARLIVQSYDSLYYEAASGAMYGRNVSRDEYELKNMWTEVYGNNVFVNREWEKHHDEYVTSIPTGMSLLDDQDDSDRFIRSATQNILANVKDTAAFLEFAGREYDALMLRARMALACAEGQNGNREYLLSAEWLMEQAQDVALKTFQKMGDFTMYEPWLKAHSATTNEYYELTGKYQKLITSYKKQGLQPSFTRFYRADAVLPKATDNAAYMESVEEAKTSSGNSVIDSGMFERYLSVISKITYSEYIPVMVYSSVCGFFLGGIFSALEMGVLGKWLGIAFFGLSLIITLFRSINAGINRNYESDERKYLLVMMLLTVMLNVQFIVGMIVFVVLKLMAKKYQ